MPKATRRPPQPWENGGEEDEDRQKTRLKTKLKTQVENRVAKEAPQDVVGGALLGRADVLGWAFLTSVGFPHSTFSCVQMFWLEVRDVSVGFTLSGVPSDSL